ncbi:MAG: enoyl-CoA hydratase/isomerase family protein [Dehalococcoidia bacterium]|jgi:2-(1,2-epoxy-1,2-dihydrophenyl)acetyl-CoA isomerase|nr:enoyl-CoA hydratase/isomerase family protein [Dehalococcoidia bacterium]
MHDPGICAITFNTPDRLNGFTPEIKRDLIEVLTQVQMDDATRVVLFTGEGRAFCAGDDISGRRPTFEGDALVPTIPRGHENPIGTYEGLRVLSQTVNSAVRNLDKLCIAAINGVAIQTGFSLALACDFRIASSEARMGSATLRFGLLPDEGGQTLLVQLMGVGKAMDFMMRKRIVMAQEALELGLVHEVVAPDELAAKSMELATELANGPQVAMRLLKRTIYNAAEMTWAHSLDDIAAKTGISDHHPDVREGTTAFRERREPHFNEWLEASD